MWFLFVEIFFLIALAFFVGAGVTAVALRLLVRGADNEAQGAEVPS